jgi:hypothetical protein
MTRPACSRWRSGRGTVSTDGISADRGIRHNVSIQPRGLGLGWGQASGDPAPADAPRSQSRHDAPATELDQASENIRSPIEERFVKAAT